MGIVSFNPNITGNQGVSPSRYTLVTTDSLSTVTTAGYLNTLGQVLNTYKLQSIDYIDTIFSYSKVTKSGTYAVFTPSIAVNGVVTLSEWMNVGNVVFPVVAGDFAAFDGTTGNINDPGFIPSNPTNPALRYVAMVNGVLETDHIMCAADANGTMGETYLLNTKVFKTTLASSPDPQSNIIINNITATAANLASAGKVIIQGSNSIQQFIVNKIFVDYSAAGLTAGGGNRELAITDGVTVYATITAALLGAPVNTAWGGSGIAFPATTACNTLTAPGVSLYAQYTGGTTDFTLGSINITVETILVV